MNNGFFENDDSLEEKFFTKTDETGKKAVFVPIDEKILNDTAKNRGKLASATQPRVKQEDITYRVTKENDWTPGRIVKQRRVSPQMLATFKISFVILIALAMVGVVIGVVYTVLSTYGA